MLAEFASFATSHFSPLRGIIAASSIIIFILLFARRRKKAIQLGDYLFWLFITAVFATLSIFPTTIQMISEYGGLDGTGRYDRLITIAYLAIILLFFNNYRQQQLLQKNRLNTERYFQSVHVGRFLDVHDLKPKGDEAVVLVPAYNEGDSISAVLSKVPAELFGVKLTTIVISDGSTDKTVEEALSCNVHVVDLPINSGQAFAYRTGYSIAIRSGFKYVLHLDADGQYDPEELHRLLKPLVDGTHELVSGSRLLGQYEQRFQADNRARSIGLYLFNFVLTILTGRKITDSASGFRGITTELLAKLHLEQRQFFSSELLIESIKKGARYKEVPINFRGRISGQSKKPGTLYYGLGFARTILKSWLKN